MLIFQLRQDTLHHVSGEEDKLVACGQVQTSANVVTNRSGRIDVV